ncbi:hypothetical protein Bbelb_096660 [Branchiostoma belcheri]|nr:hypothetical protein Bbelb_096660 [Branchiostoma belcheri]
MSVPSSGGTYCATSCEFHLVHTSGDQSSCHPNVRTPQSLRDNVRYLRESVISFRADLTMSLKLKPRQGRPRKFSDRRTSNTGYHPGGAPPLGTPLVPVKKLSLVERSGQGQIKSAETRLRRDRNIDQPRSDMARGLISLGQVTAGTLAVACGSGEQINGSGQQSADVSKGFGYRRWDNLSRLR